MQSSSFALSRRLQQQVPSLVAIQAAAAPNSLAISDGEHSLTYSELDERAGRLASLLNSIGVGPDIVVGLYLNRSVAMVVGALAILKAGGAYLPLDPACPQDLLAFIVKDAQAEILVTGECMLDKLQIRPRCALALDSGGRTPSAESAEPITVNSNPESLAYVIYTSGSTGRPKGVEITHACLVNLVKWHQCAFRVTPADRTSQLSALGFDAAVWEIWPSLTAGASVHLPRALAVNEPTAVRDWLVSQGITIGFLPTPLAERAILLEWPTESRLRIMLTGADTLHRYPSPELPFELVNNYGPTECTVVSTSGTVPPQAHPHSLPTIGRPIANVQIYVLDERMEPVPTGEAGELYIGGASLARGYRNRPDLTTERFVEDPFHPGTRLYKTGDLGRRLPDGQFAFLGRIDDQVKVRGFRIEPAEIAQALDQHPSVQMSVVVARESEAGDKHLVAYFVPSGASELTHSELREFIARRLPHYMVPGIFVKLEAMPVNGNGKVDRALLPTPCPDNTVRDNCFTAPRTLLEERVAAILAGLLGIGRVGVEDNFFLLGGHSLLGTQLIARIRLEFGVDLSLRSLFDAPTVEKLSRQIESLLIIKLEAMSEEEAQRLLDAATDNAREKPKAA